MRPKIAVLACLMAMLVWLGPAQGQSVEEMAKKVAELRQYLREGQPIRLDFDGVVAFGPQVAMLLEPMIEGDVIERVAGGMVLSRIAVEKGVNEQVVQKLVQLANDSAPGVAYWGYYGLTMSPHVDDEVAKEWTVKSLESRRPMVALRLLGCEAAAKREIGEAAPWLVALIRNRKPDYERAKATIFVEQVEIEPEQDAAPGRPDPRRPDPRRPAEPARAPWEEVDLDEDDMDYERREEPPAPKFKTRPIVVGETHPTVIRAQGNLLEQHAAVEEIRRAGVALEKVTGEDFRFSTAPPWVLPDAISRALGWFEQNKGRYSKGPGLEEARPEPAEDAPPAPPTPAPPGD